MSPPKDSAPPTFRSENVRMTTYQEENITQRKTPNAESYQAAGLQLYGHPPALALAAPESIEYTVLPREY
jgi:hypothetical protein